MSDVLEIAGKAARIAFTVHGYERAAATDSSDANWLVCTIEASVAGFEGKIETSLTTQDLRRLHDDLQVLLATLDGRLAFTPDEDAVSFEAEMMRDGRMIVAGELKTRIGAEASMRFRFDSDQSYFQATLKQLILLCREYPQRMA